MDRDTTVRVDGERFPIGQIDCDGVCVVTVRSTPQPQHATLDILNILAELTAVSLVTTALAPDSPIHDRFDVDEIDSAGSEPAHVFQAAIRFLTNQLRLGVALTRHEADVVWFFGATAYLLPVLMARLSGKRVVLQSRGDVPLTLRLRWQERIPSVLARGLAAIVRMLEFLSFLLAARFVTYSPSMAESLGRSPDHPRVSCLGSRFVDLDAFRPTTPYTERDRAVGFIGRLDPEKGVDLLIATARELPPDVTFVFVGDGPHRDRIERSLAEAIEAGRVEIAGWVAHDEIPTYLNRLRLLVMPSAPTEGLPTVIAESFACGTPVYASPVSGIGDLLLDGETGFHLTETSGGAVADRIESILDREDLDRIAHRCRSVAEERYSFGAAVNRYRSILSGL